MQIVEEWYNAEYTALEGEIEPYQICEICDPPPKNENLEDVIDIIASFVQGKNIRVARAAIRIICREALRQNKERLSPDVIE